MSKAVFTIELDYAAELMYGDDPESRDWFINKVLLGANLVLHDNDIGDSIGAVKTLEIWRIDDRSEERTSAQQGDIAE